MATIFDALQNAHYNLTENAGNPFAEGIGRNQLTNTVALLDLGYPLDADVETLIEEHGSLEAVPEYQPR